MAEEGVHMFKLSIGMLTKSQTPSFQVRMMEWMVDGRTYRMEFPPEFLQEHGDKIQPEVTLEKTWTSGLQVRWSTQVKIVKSFGKVKASFHGGGWKSFVIANELKVGDMATFFLLESSRFIVHVAPMSISKNIITTPNYVKDSVPVVKTQNKINIGPPGPSTTSTANSKQAHQTGDDDSVLSLSKTLSSSTNTPIRNAQEPSAGANSMRPSFEKKLRRSHIRHMRHQGQSMREPRMTIPMSFVHLYCKDLKEVVTLCGPSSKVMKVKCKSNHIALRSSDRTELTQGWGEFLDENQFKEGDTLLFSLTARSHFNVQSL